MRIRTSAKRFIFEADATTWMAHPVMPAKISVINSHQPLAAEVRRGGGSPGARANQLPRSPAPLRAYPHREPVCAYERMFRIRSYLCSRGTVGRFRWNRAYAHTRIRPCAHAPRRPVAERLVQGGGIPRSRLVGVPHVYVAAPRIAGRRGRNNLPYLARLISDTGWLHIVIQCLGACLPGPEHRYLQSKCSICRRVARCWISDTILDKGFTLFCGINYR